MNYWLRGKDLDLDGVAEAGELVYNWAKAESVLLPEMPSSPHTHLSSRSYSPPPALEMDSQQDSQHDSHHSSIMPISPQRDEPLSPVRSSRPTPVHTPIAPGFNQRFHSHHSYEQGHLSSLNSHVLVSPSLQHATAHMSGTRRQMPETVRERERVCVCVCVCVCVQLACSPHR